MKKEKSWVRLTYVKLISDRDIAPDEALKVWAYDVDTREILEKITFVPGADSRERTQWPVAFANKINTESRYLAAGTEVDDGTLSTEWAMLGVPLWSRAIENRNVWAFMAVPFERYWVKCPDVPGADNPVLFPDEEQEEERGYKLLVTAQTDGKEVLETCVPKFTGEKETWPFILCSYVNTHSQYVRGGVIKSGAGLPVAEKNEMSCTFWQPVNFPCDVTLVKCSPDESTSLNSGEPDEAAGEEENATPAGLNKSDHMQQLPAHIVSGRDVQDGETVRVVAFDPKTGAILQQTFFSPEGDERAASIWPSGLACAINTSYANQSLIAAGTPVENDVLSTDWVPDGIPLWNASGKDLGAFTTSPAASNWLDGGPLPDAGDLLSGEILQMTVTRRGQDTIGEGYLYESLSVTLPEAFRTQYHWPFYLSHYINSHCRYVRAGELRAPDSGALITPRYSPLRNRLWVPAHSDLEVCVSVRARDENVVSLTQKRPGLAERLDALFSDATREVLAAETTQTGLDMLEAEMSAIEPSEDIAAQFWQLYDRAQQLLISSTIKHVEIDVENRVTVTFSQAAGRSFSAYNYRLMHEERYPSTEIARLYQVNSAGFPPENNVWSVQATARKADTFRIEVQIVQRSGLTRIYTAWPLAGKAYFNNANPPPAQGEASFRSLEARLNDLFINKEQTQLAEALTLPVLDMLATEIGTIPDGDDRKLAYKTLLDKAQLCLLRSLLITPVEVDAMNVVHVRFSEKGGVARTRDHFLLRVNKEDAPRSVLKEGVATGSALTDDGVWVTPVVAGPADYFSIEVLRGGITWVVYASVSSGLDLEQKIRDLFTDEVNCTALKPVSTQQHIDDLEEELAARTAISQDRHSELTELLDKAQHLLLEETLQKNAEGLPDVSFTDLDSVRVAFNSLPYRDYRQYVYHLMIKRSQYNVLIAVMDKGQADATSTESENMWTTPADVGMNEQIEIVALRTVRGKPKRYVLYTSAEVAFYAYSVQKMKKKLGALFNEPYAYEALADDVNQDILSQREQELVSMKLKPLDNTILSEILQKAQTLLNARYETAVKDVENMLNKLFDDSQQTSLRDNLLQGDLDTIEQKMTGLNLEPEDNKKLAGLYEKAQLLLLKETIDMNKFVFKKVDGSIGHIEVKFLESKSRDFKNYEYLLYYKSKEYNEIEIAKLVNNKAFFTNPESKEIKFQSEIILERYINSKFKHALEIRVVKKFLGEDKVFILHTSPEI